MDENKVEEEVVVPAEPTEEELKKIEENPVEPAEVPAVEPEPVEPAPEV